MAIYDGNEMAEEHLLEIAKMCAQAALKAPQVTATLELKTKIITSEDILPIIEIYGEMAKFWSVMKMDYCTHAGLIEAKTPYVLLLMGADLTQSETYWDCGACGFSTCLEFNKYSRENRGMGSLYIGPSCNWKLFDFSMACDWSCAAAHQYNVENRIQGTIGSLAASLGYIEGCSNVVGLPLVSKREWFYNRPSLMLNYTDEEWKNLALQSTPVMFTGFTGTGKPVIKTTDKWWEIGKQYIKVEEDPKYEAIIAEAQGKMMEIITRKRKELEENKKEELTAEKKPE